MFRLSSEPIKTPQNKCTSSEKSAGKRVNELWLALISISDWSWRGPKRSRVKPKQRGLLSTLHRKWLLFFGKRVFHRSLNEMLFGCRGSMRDDPGPSRWGRSWLSKGRYTLAYVTARSAEITQSKPHMVGELHNDGTEIQAQGKSGTLL